MKHTLGIFLFTVLVTAFYGYVGQLVPQKETYPPRETEVGEDLTTSEMVDAGREIYEGKGTCVSCHTIGSGEAGRFPDLAGIGASSASRVESLSDVEYLAESLYEPDLYIVDGFRPGMPAVDKPPISLNPQEVLAVVAYLQDIAGLEVTVEIPSEPVEEEVAAAPGEPRAPFTAPEDAIAEFACGGCHKIAGEVGELGPDLTKIGASYDRDYLRRALLDPDADIAEGFEPEMMPDDYGEQMYAAELELLVDYLANQK